MKGSVVAFGWLVWLMRPSSVGAVELPKYVASPAATVVPTEAVKLPWFPERISCQRIEVVGGDEVAPAEVEVVVRGEGKVGVYRVDWGDGRVEEGVRNSWQHGYEAPGTYEIKGYVSIDGKEWLGGVTDCRQTVKLWAAKPMITQPETGPGGGVWMMILGLMVVSGLVRWWVGSWRA